MTFYNEYDASDVVIITGEFKTVAGDYIDPTTVTLSYRKPGDTAATVLSYPADITKLDVGIYQATIDTQGGPDGVWPYRWESSGNLESAEEWAFIVKHSDVVDLS